MDMVSVPYNSFFEKKAMTNGHSHMNGHALKTNGHSALNGHSEQGHSDFMKIQRYEDLIGISWMIYISRFLIVFFPL